MEYTQVFNIESPNEFDLAVEKIKKTWQNYRTVTLIVEEEITAQEDES